MTGSSRKSMNRRVCLAVAASIPMFGGCLSGTRDDESREFLLDGMSVLSPPGSLELEIREPVDEDGRPTANSITPDRDGRLVFELTNPGDESVSLNTPPPAPFGVLEASSANHQFPLWSERYEESAGVEINGSEATVASDPVSVEIEPGGSLERTYEIRHSTLVDGLPEGIDEQFDVTGDVRIDTDTDGEHTWNVRFRLYEGEQYEG